MRVVLSGATGKVGRALEPAIRTDPELELVGRAAPSLGQSLEDVLDGIEADVVVDFSVPAAALGACELAARRRVPLVIGTTGPSAEEWRAAGERARAAGVPLVHAPNFAVGAVLMMRFAEEAARHMAAAEIVELHAETKRDRPSGTARATAARMGGDVPVHSVRLPGLVAHQEVLLGGRGELLTIRHDTTSREAFVPGVLLALRRLAELPPGLTLGLEALLSMR